MSDLSDRLSRASASFRKLNPWLFSGPQSPSAPSPAISPSPKPKKPAKSARVARTRNAGTLTEAAYWTMVRSGLRRTFRFWKPALAALKAARTPRKGPRGQKWAYLCADCKKLFLRKQVQIDHVEPVGTLLDYEHVGDFLRRLTPEDPAAFSIRCKACHQTKTNQERDHSLDILPENNRAKEKAAAK